MVPATSRSADNATLATSSSRDQGRINVTSPATEESRERYESRHENHYGNHNESNAELLTSFTGSLENRQHPVHTRSQDEEQLKAGQELASKVDTNASHTETGASHHVPGNVFAESEQPHSENQDADLDSAEKGHSGQKAVADRKLETRQAVQEWQDPETREWKDDVCPDLFKIEFFPPEDVSFHADLRFTTLCGILASKYRSSPSIAQTIRQILEIGR